MRQCYWICFRLFKYFLPDRKAGQVSLLVPQAMLRSLIQLSLCFVYVHNSQSASKYLSAHETLDTGLGPGGLQCPMAAAIKKCCDGEMESDTGPRAGASTHPAESERLPRRDISAKSSRMS